MQGVHIRITSIVWRHWNCVEIWRVEFGKIEQYKIKTFVELWRSVWPRFSTTLYEALVAVSACKVFIWHFLCVTFRSMPHIRILLQQCRVILSITQSSRRFGDGNIFCYGAFAQPTACVLTSACSNIVRAFRFFARGILGWRPSCWCINSYFRRIQWSSFCPHR